jgi:hypothetical protein
MARSSNSNVLYQIAKFFLLLSEAPSYWPQPQYQLLIVASSSVILIVVNLIHNAAPHNTPAFDCCVQQHQSSSLSPSWRWSWVIVMWCAKVGHCHPLRPLILSLQPSPSSLPLPSACRPPLSPSPLPCRPRPLRCPRATLIVITIALATLALALLVARQPRHHHHHPRRHLHRRHRHHHRPCCRRSPITLVAIAQLLPSPSSSHATLVINAILLVVALALFIAHHPHCRHQRPLDPCPLCCCHHHPPHAIVIRCRPPSWSCGCLIDALSPATARLR